MDIKTRKEMQKVMTDLKNIIAEIEEYNLTSKQDYALECNLWEEKFRLEGILHKFLYGGPIVNFTAIRLAKMCAR